MAPTKYEAEGSLFNYPYLGLLIYSDIGDSRYLIREYQTIWLHISQDNIFILMPVKTSNLKYIQIHMLKITEVRICYYQALKPESNTLATLLATYKYYDNCIQHS
jgi:hypothetical protein